MRWSGKTALLVMAAADLVIFGGWIGVQEWGLRRGVEVKLPAEGYDPRDLISGHYVRFRLTAEHEAKETAPEGIAGTTSFCLEARGDRWHVRSPRLVGDSCAPFVSGTWTDGQFKLGVERFYVDERLASQVGWIPAGSDTYLLARVDSGGGIHAVDLVVSGKSLRHP
jgi:hypothetical protein